jgi:hypothetical protein
MPSTKRKEEEDETEPVLLAPGICRNSSHLRFGNERGREPGRLLGYLRIAIHLLVKTENGTLVNLNGGGGGGGGRGGAAGGGGRAN